MFSLIITVISIALVAALAVSTLYFGGDAFNAGSDKAKASTIVNQAQQIDGANTIHRLDHGELEDDVADLTPDYLGSEPVVNENISSNGYTLGGVDDDTITLSDVATSVCEEVNAEVGLTADVADAAAMADEDVQYGCTTDDDFIFNP